MALPVSQQRVLDTIENELQSADPQLAGKFAGFTSMTRNARMPVAEQLRGRGRRTARRPSRSKRRRALLGWLPMFIAIGLLVATGVSLSLSALHQSRCETATTVAGHSSKSASGFGCEPRSGLTKPAPGTHHG
jgi:hypothetical protein